MALEAWSSPVPYERFMGRWSRLLAAEVVSLLDPPPGLRWLDVGCGTGALSAALLAAVSPLSLVGLDPSAEYVRMARERQPDPRARFAVGDATALELPDASVDRVVCGLVLNFVPDPAAAVREMQRVLAPGGRLALADIVSERPLAESITCDAELWAACVGGAAQIDDYHAAIEKAGLSVDATRDNTAYAFLSGSARGATETYGIKSISLLALKP